MKLKILLFALALVLALMFFAAGADAGTTYNSNGSPDDIQRIHDTLAHDGDVITMPAGAFTWTRPVQVRKNISVLGVPGQTILNDAIAKPATEPGAFHCILPSRTTLFRISGIKFNATGTGNDTGSLGEITVDGISSTPNVRIDNCEFNLLHLRPIVFFGGIWGVVDHCNFTMGPWVGGINIRHSVWKGVGNYGDNSWADDPNWGSEQAIFLEDCTFRNFSSATWIDGDGGMRVVARYCDIIAGEAGNHGTETGQRYRSGRTFELYRCNLDGGNLIHNWAILIRGGSALIWGNYADRYDSLVKFQEFRLWFPATPWGQANGLDPWDLNDPQIFESGTATGAGDKSMTDSSKNWPADHWKGYILRNLTRGTSSQVSSNDAHTIHFDGNPQGQSMTFSPGDLYELRWVSVVLDQPGHGKGDLISGTQPSPVAWPHQTLEPVRIWDNELGPNFGNGNGRPIISTDAQNLSPNRDWIFCGEGDDSC